MVAAIIQARMSSSRLPGKIMLDLHGKPMLEQIVRRISMSKRVNMTIVATSREQSDDRVEQFCQERDIAVFRGSLDNVLERYAHCARQYGADVIVRCTADNALICPEIIDEAVKLFMEKKPHYLSYKASLPVGMKVEAFTFRALEKAFAEAKDPECLEHVTPYIWRNPHVFQVLTYRNPADRDYSSLRFTMDEPKDYEFVKRIYESFPSNSFTWRDMIRLLTEHPEWLEINRQVRQNVVRYGGEEVQ